MTKQIIINIEPDGNVNFEVQGVKGPECLNLTKFLEELGEVETRTYTSEYHDSEVHQTTKVGEE